MLASSHCRPFHSRAARRTQNRRLFLEPLEDRRLLAINIVEAEPNDTTAAANPIERVLDERVTISGRVNALGDRDWFRIDLHEGDVFGAALSGQKALNPAIRLVNSDGELQIANDNSGFFGTKYLPPESPLPHDQQANPLNAELYYVI